MLFQYIADSTHRRRDRCALPLVPLRLRSRPLATAIRAASGVGTCGASGVGTCGNATDSPTPLALLFTAVPFITAPGGHAFPPGP